MEEEVSDRKADIELVREVNESRFDIIPGSLSSLADEINEAHNQLEGHFKYTLNYAIYAGECLTRAKALCGHGNWLEWHGENINHSEDTSHRYIKLATHKDYILANSANLRNLTMDGALKLLTAGKPMLQSSGREWWTPKKYIDAIHEVMGEIDLDPASCKEANKVVGAKKIYTELDDGLSMPWKGKVFLNPPYGKVGPAFVEKLYNELNSSVNEAILLVNSRATDAEWFQKCFDGLICFTDHRIDFNSPGEKASSSTHGSCIVYFGPNKEKFVEAFSKFGNVVWRWPNEKS